VAREVLITLDDWRRMRTLVEDGGEGDGSADDADDDRP
jgi:hypothetical protein